MKDFIEMVMQGKKPDGTTDDVLASFLHGKGGVFEARAAHIKAYNVRSSVTNLPPSAMELHDLDTLLQRGSKYAQTSRCKAARLAYRLKQMRGAGAVGCAFLGNEVFKGITALSVAGRKNGYFDQAYGCLVDGDLNGGLECLYGSRRCEYEGLYDEILEEAGATTASNFEEDLDELMEHINTWGTDDSSEVSESAVAPRHCLDHALVDEYILSEPAIKTLDHVYRWFFYWEWK